MLSVLVWWLAIQGLALLALPIAYRLLRFLPDRGVSMARPVGLLLGGYGLWILVTLGLLRNTTTGVVAVLAFIGLASALLLGRDGRSLGAFLRGARRQILVTEVLFALGLAGWAFFRAHNPEIAATEKPMEYAFLNGILRSETFPPRDPWLSGYGISYYYLGYVLMALLTRLTGLASAVTFNLTNATLFALTLSGAYALAHNLAAARRARPAGGSWGAVACGLLGGGLVALVGNLEGIFEVLRARGWGSEALFRWLDVRNLTVTPPSATWYPDDGWWWWRASRIIHDRDAAGQSMEVISEFPFFSFLLGDNHPHVLALPFILLALALALNVLLAARPTTDPEAAEGVGWRRFLADLGRGWWGDVPLWGLLLGGLAFLNTWDYPIYLGIFLLAYAARRAWDAPAADRGWLRDALTMGLVLGGLGAALYLPFFVGFRSQAGGVGLTGAIRTRPHQFLLMFGTQIALVIGFLAAVAGRAARRWRAGGRARAAWIVAGVGLGLAVLCLVAGWWTAALGLALGSLAAGLAVDAVAAHAAEAEVPDGVADAAPAGAEPAASAAPVVLSLIMVVAALVLTTFVEFAFLRDSFGTRMNTVFKFYYQAWVLLSLAGAYGVYHVLSARPRGAPARLVRGGWLVAGGLLLAAGLAYTVTAPVAKANGFRGEPTLDGARYVAAFRPQEAEVVRWLAEHAPPGAVLLEAPGRQFSDDNWVSAATGIPTLLGWGGHELQWRGSYEEPARREGDIAAIYQGADPARVAALLEAYAVDYLLVGPREREQYGVGPLTLARLDRLLVRAYENPQYIIYSARGDGREG